MSPRQNDATDGIYPFELSNPLALFKINEFTGIGPEIISYSQFRDDFLTGKPEQHGIVDPVGQEIQYNTGQMPEIQYEAIFAG